MALSSGAFALYRNVRLRKQVCCLEQNVAEQSRLAELLTATRCELANLHNRFDAVEKSRREQAEWAAQTDSLNLNRRGQVMRLHRRGDSTTDIAKSLQLGVGEVALIIKVFEMGRKSEGDGERSRN
jgi:DNA-binding NarL/FixJ family response regulator